LTGWLREAAVPSRYYDKFPSSCCDPHTRRASVRGMTQTIKRNTPSHPERTVYLAAESAGNDGSSLMSSSSSDYTLGERICKARDASGLSTAQLARRLGIKTGTLHSWESDRSEPRSNKLVLLAGVLNVSPTWLLVGRGTPPAMDAPRGVRPGCHACGSGPGPTPGANSCGRNRSIAGTPRRRISLPSFEPIRFATPKPKTRLLSVPVHAGTIRCRRRNHCPLELLLPCPVNQPFRCRRRSGCLRPATVCAQFLPFSFPELTPGRDTEGR